MVRRRYFIFIFYFHFEHILFVLSSGFPISTGYIIMYTGTESGIKSDLGQPGLESLA